MRLVLAIVHSRRKITKKIQSKSKVEGGLGYTRDCLQRERERRKKGRKRRQFQKAL